MPKSSWDPESEKRRANDAGPEVPTDRRAKVRAKVLDNMVLVWLMAAVN